MDNKRHLYRHVRFALAVASLTLLVPVEGLASAATLTDMRNHRRVILIFVAESADEGLRKQRAYLQAWTGADERDITVVEVVGDAVFGASDSASALRERFRASSTHHEFLLIGKDGHVALRYRTPIDTDTLTRVIDAMPMRQSGLR